MAKRIESIAKELQQQEQSLRVKLKWQKQIELRTIREEQNTNSNLKSKFTQI